MRTPSSGRFFLVAALGLGVLSGCSIFGPEACTVVGCFNGLTVRLTSLPTEPYTVELRVPGAQEPIYSYECDGGPSCEQVIHSPLETLSRISVKVTTDTGLLVTEVLDVDYVETWPNGRDCPPPCRNATVTAEVPV